MYIVFEGLDGVGKSTQIELLKPEFQNALFTLEPGATEFGKHIRKLLLESEYKFDTKTELMLFLADRANHFEQVLKPNADKLIISDRSVISGIAYASVNFSLESLLFLNDFVLEDFFPKKAIFLQADEEVLRQRLVDKGLDKIEQRGFEYFMNIQENFKKTLLFLKEQKNLEFITLEACEDKLKLHKLIKEFIND